MQSAFTWWKLVAAGVVGLMSAACVEIEGGAVEVGWDLRHANGVRIESDGCEKASLEKMALTLREVEGGGDPCEGQDHCRFSCSPWGFGTTGFVIPEGRYAIMLEVLDTTGKVLEEVEGIVGPGPVIRQVKEGEITSMNVQLIIVER